MRPLLVFDDRNARNREVLLPIKNRSWNLSSFRKRPDKITTPTTPVQTNYLGLKC